jgi:hypothetical protein
MKELHEGHDHSHDGCDHDHGAAPDLAKITALLEYLTDHNSQHAAEVGDIAHHLHHAGKGEAARLLEDAVKDFEAGSGKLAQALALIKGGM